MTNQLDLPTVVPLPVTSQRDHEPRRPWPDDSGRFARGCVSAAVGMAVAAVAALAIVWLVWMAWGLVR